MNDSLFAALCGALLLCACGSVSDKPDAGGSADACVPETDQELCGSSGCETASFTDRCGTTRSVDCGSCATGLGCVVNTCKTPVCTTFNYAVQTLATFSRTGVEDTLGAATPDGSVIVLIPTATGSSCGAFTVSIADEIAPGSGTYNTQSITAALTGKTIVAQDSYAITTDGLTLIARSPDSTKWVQVSRSAKGMTDFGEPEETAFAQINAALPAGASVFAPVISADGLQFIYSVSVASNTAVSGIYSSVRTSTTVPFPAGAKLGAPISDYAYASALSSDRLTLFVFYAFSGRVFTRTSTSGDWVNPNAPADPPLLGGWQQKPLANCARMLAMGNAAGSGGCQNEDILVLNRQ